jgi:aminopeptidase YwaD
LRNIYFIFLLFIPLTLKAQPDNYARALIDSLCSERYHGRGYVNNGDIKTALFIENEFKNIGLSPINNKYLQKFGFTINSFPGEMFVKLDQKELSPGKDYLIQLYSRSVKGKFKITPINKKDFINDRKMNKLLKRKLTDHFLLVDLSELDNNQKQKLQEELFVYKEVAAGLILLNDKKLTWGAGNYFSTLPIVEISKGAWINGTKEIELSIHSELIDNHETYNVIGQVPAEQYSDSFIVFTAHYDHLGRMGKEIIFPGANDNASGTALLLSLAKKYKTKPNIKYNIL